MAKISCSTPIISIVDGEPIIIDGRPKLDSDGKPVIVDGKPVIAGDPETLATVAMRALLNITPGEKIVGEESFKRFQIAQKFSGKKKTVELSSEEIVFVKKVIGEVFGPAIVGPTWNILESGESTVGTE